MFLAGSPTSIRLPLYFQQDSLSIFIAMLGCSCLPLLSIVPLREMVVYTIISKGAKIRNRYNQVPNLTKDTRAKVTNSQLDTTNDGVVITWSVGEYRYAFKGYHRVCKQTIVSLEDITGSVSRQ